MGRLLWMVGAVFFLFVPQGLVVMVRADALVTGVVFCDQCRDGDRTLFDYPLFGAKVAVVCSRGGGTTAYKEESTNWFGSYAVRFKGRADLSGCYARVVGGPERCGASAGPAEKLKRLFGMFGTEMYTVDPLLSQPAVPKSFCPHHHAPAPPTVPGYRPPAPPRTPRLQPPPLHFLDASACTFDKWMMPEYKCYWKLVSPETKVALAFGPVAAGKYGTNMTLWEGLEGRGDVYRTLLREATTSLLNSYHTLGFFYPTLSVIDHMNWALLGSSHDALMIALRFRRANSGSSGSAKVTCNFNPCS